MSLITKKWAFRNGSETRIVQAIDGPSAWHVLAKELNYRSYAGFYVMPMTHSWYIRCVCPCGAISVTSFYSQACFETWKKNDAFLG